MNNADIILKIACEFEEFVKNAKRTNKWIQKIDLKEGRWKGWTLKQMRKRYNELKRKEDKTKKEISEMRSLGLGIRFKQKGGVETKVKS